MNRLKGLLVTALLAMLAVFGGALTAGADTAGEAAREAAYGAMKEMATVVWVPSKTVYYHHSEVGGSKWTKGTYYVGIPYTQSMSNIDRFRAGFENWNSSLDLLMNFQPWVPVQYTSDGEGNQDTIDILMGNDCSGAIYWALAKVADVSFTGTNRTLPQNNSGLVYPVLDDPTVVPLDYNDKNGAPAKDYTYDVIHNSKTGEVTISFEDMSKYYASLKKGDILVGTASAEQTGGDTSYHHMAMVESVDAEAKTIRVIQHGGMSLDDQYTSYKRNLLDGMDSSVTDKITKLGQILWAYGDVTFEGLYSKNYVPLTLPEYESTDVKKGNVTVDGAFDAGNLYLATGTVTAHSFRLESVTIEIDNADGTKLDSVTLYTSTYRFGMNNNQSAQRAIENSMDLIEFAPYLNAMGMEKGTNYTYKLSARLSDGNDYLLKQFRFTY